MSARIRKIMVAAWTVAALQTGISLQAAAPEFTEDFSKSEVGKAPAEFLILDGRFAVREEDGNKFLELPGAPLESFGAMFGPSHKENWGAQARFHATSKGRKYPVFAISLNGFAGYRLTLAPAKRAVEIQKGDQIVASAPYEKWKSGAWTLLRLQVRKDGETWKVEGKAWPEGEQEPADWTINFTEKEEPLAGRPAVWGMPFSGTPIRFDDLKIFATES
jgi:hypothetical protein